MTADTPLVAYLGVAWRRKYFILLPAVLGLVVAAVALRFMPPIYLATATVMSRQEGEPSRDYLRPIINPTVPVDLKELNERAKTVEFLQGLAVRLKGKLPAAVPQGREADYLRASYYLDVNGSMILFRCRQKNPAMAATIANAAAEHFIATIGRRKAERSEELTDFFNQQFEERKRALDVKDREIAQFKQMHRGSLPEDSATNMAAMASAKSEALRIQGDLEAREQELAGFLERVAGQADGTLAAVVPLSQDPGAGLARLEAELAQMLLTMTDKHPDVIAKRAEIEAVRKAIAQRASQVPAPGQEPAPVVDVGLLNPVDRVRKETLERGIVALKLRQAAAQREVALYEARLSEGRQLETELTRMYRDRDAVAAEYQQVLSSKRGAEISQEYLEAGATGQFSFEARALVPLSPEKPVPSTVLGVGLIVGLALGVGLVVLLELLDQTFRYPEEIQAQFEIPVIATVARLSLPDATRDRRREKRRKAAV